MKATAREFKVLRALSGSLVEGRGGLPFIGTKTLTDMLAKSWIEEVARGAVGQQLGYRITAAGREIYAAGQAKKVRQPPRLKMMPSRLKITRQPLAD